MKRIYPETVKKWLIGSGISVTTLIGGIFIYLTFFGLITITGNSGDMVCAGTENDPCYALVNFTANEDIFLYPTNYDPWGRNTTFSFYPGVKDWKLQRSWGTGWRDIPLDKTCTGTWCGAPNNLGVAYSYVFREGRDYQLRVVAYKNKPSDVIKWAVEYEDREYLDPVWLAVDSNIFTYNKEENTNITYYIKDKDEKIIIPYEDFLDETDKFGWVFNETSIESELAKDIQTSDIVFDNKIYYELQSDKDYFQHSKYLLSRDLGTTRLVKNEIGQWVKKPVKRFIDFSEVFRKPHNLYDYITTEENVTVCLEYNETSMECLKEIEELQNITRKYNRDISFSIYPDKTSWIIEFFNLFDLDPEFKDDTDSNWEAGTMINMEVEGTGEGANLTSNKTTGGFLSQIFDASSSVDWKNITYNLEYPYGEELPGNQVDVAEINMTGNVLLMHFNNDSSVGENDTHVYDFSGSGNNGTVVGAVVNTTDCVFGNCMTFDGVNDYVNAPASDTDFLGALTISVWARIDTGSAFRHFAGKHLTNGVANNPFDFRTTNDIAPLLIFGRADADGYRTWAGPATTVGQLKHYVITTPSSEINIAPTFYVNGVSTTGTDYSGGGTGAVTGVNADIRIGIRADAAVKMDGTIDEVAIWNRSLSADEIKNLYNRGAARLNVSVRSCDDDACSGESFRETTNNASFGRYNDLTDLDNRYFQYMFNYTNTSSATVRVNDLSIWYDSLAVDILFNVTLLDPANNTLNDTTNTIDFYYNASGSNIENCTLFINNDQNTTTTSFTAEQRSNITIYLPNADYLWNVGCTNSSNFKLNASERNISVQAPVDSCSPTSPLSANYQYECSDNCVISSDVDANNFNITLNGTGFFLMNADIYDYKILNIFGESSTNKCHVYCSGGCFI